jgi:hypothetical protein
MDVNVLRPLIATLLLAALGCSPAQVPARVQSPAPQPAFERVRFVGRVPSRNGYRLVGRVTGTANPGGFVEAVRDARMDIRQKAVDLHASLIKIDRLRLPPKHRRGPAVLLVGRAYARVPARADEEIELVPYR